jgi:NAD(P)-dependent dehydrogenase (short-subunit alcohol dehydrogenase family)
VDELTDEVAVVTGAASGIGFALCEAFAAAGMRVVLADIHPAALEAAAERLGGDVLAVPTDVTSWDAVDELEARAVERFGNVHVLCNNAGVQLPGVTWEFTHAEWEWVLGINWGGVVHGIRSFVPGMVAHGEPGHIVNTASLGGLIAFPGR